jgi:hypothetical protein
MMENFIRRIKRLDDFSKLYGELKSINRIISQGNSNNLEELNEKKRIIEERLNELMFVTL